MPEVSNQIEVNETDMLKKESKKAQINFNFLKNMILALRSQDINPSDVGLKINTFYPSLGERYINNINVSLN